MRIYLILKSDPIFSLTVHFYSSFWNRKHPFTIACYRLDCSSYYHLKVFVFRELNVNCNEKEIMLMVWMYFQKRPLKLQESMRLPALLIQYFLYSFLSFNMNRFCFKCRSFDLFDFFFEKIAFLSYSSNLFFQFEVSFHHHLFLQLHFLISLA